MTEQTEIERGAAPESARTRPELSVNWEAKRGKPVMRVPQGSNRIKVFKETYKGMPYEIHVIYHKELQDNEAYDHGMWATLERPSGMSELYDAIDVFIKNAGAYAGDEFCYADTDHYHNEGQPINDRIQEMRTVAHDDIDTFYKFLENAGNILRGFNSIVDAVKKRGE